MKKYNITILIIILIIMFACLGLFLILWFGGSGDKYGSRLDGIKNVEISTNKLSDISKAISAKEIVSKATTDMEGRILEVMITVKDDTDVNEAKALSSLVIENLNEDHLKYYDIQIFLMDSKTKEDSKYPLIGYKHKTSEAFSWSNN